MQDELYVGSVGAYDRAGTVAKYEWGNINSPTYIKQKYLKQLLKPVNISDFKDSYLGKVFDDKYKLIVFL